MSLSPSRPFRAFYIPGSQWALYCRRCDTTETGFRLEGIHDRAKTHATWWHSKLTVTINP